MEEMLRSDVHPFLREGAEARSLAQQSILEAMQEPGESPYELGWQDFRLEMSSHLQNLVRDYALTVIKTPIVGVTIGLKFNEMLYGSCVDSQDHVIAVGETGYRSPF